MPGITPEDSPNRRVEEALLRRALGTTITETRTEVTDKGEKTVTVIKQIAPDISAQQFWLKNRDSGRWQDRPQGTEQVPQENNLLEVLRQAAEEL